MRRRFTPECNEQTVARPSEPEAACARLPAELGGTSIQLKTWRWEPLAAESTAAIAQTKAEAFALAPLRHDAKQLKQENEVMRQASIFFAQRVAKTAMLSSISSPPMPTNIQSVHSDRF
jgi:transposase-like protein